jgi:hypothetical protein
VIEVIDGWGFICTGLCTVALLCLYLCCHLLVCCFGKWPSPVKTACHCIELNGIELSMYSGRNWHIINLTVSFWEFSLWRVVMSILQLKIEIQFYFCIKQQTKLWFCNVKFLHFFKVCKSVHHHTFYINHQPDAKLFQFIILTFIYSSTCFGRFPAYHQEHNDCSGSLWF